MRIRKPRAGESATARVDAPLSSSRPSQGGARDRAAPPRSRPLRARTNGRTCRSHPWTRAGKGHEVGGKGAMGVFPRGGATSSAHWPSRQRPSAHAARDGLIMGAQGGVRRARKRPGRVRLAISTAFGFCLGQSQGRGGRANRMIWRGSFFSSLRARERIPPPSLTGASAPPGKRFRSSTANREGNIKTLAQTILRCGVANNSRAHGTGYPN